MEIYLIHTSFSPLVLLFVALVCSLVDHDCVYVIFSFVFVSAFSKMLLCVHACTAVAYVFICACVLSFWISRVYVCVFPGNEASTVSSCLCVLAQALDAR